MADAHKTKAARNLLPLKDKVCPEMLHSLLWYGLGLCLEGPRQGLNKVARKGLGGWPPRGAEASL